MRTTYALKNMLSSLSSHFVSMLLGFISQAIFVRTLGSEYLGINGLFSNIVSMLAVVELGIGSAIVYNLYKPIAEKDKETVKTLMSFYKRCYRVIAIIISVIGLLIIPFLKIIVGETTIQESTILIIYLLFIIDTVCSYLLTYKRSMLYANQRNYIIDIIHILYLFILNAIQIIILLTTKNYILYLSFKILMRLLENIVITIVVNKQYSFLLDKDIKKIDKITLNEIIKKVKGLIVHKIGVFLVAGTDNIIIASFLGVATVGIYSNYYMIINAISTIVNQIFSSFKASIGNLLVTSNAEKNYDVFRKLQFINFWFAMFSSIGEFIVMESFIKVWVGEEYILPRLVLMVLCINNYVYITKLCSSNFKEAAGIFYEDRIIPIIESIVNIVFSIIFLKIFGLAGVFMGTICSNLITHIYTYPKFIYGKLFKKKYSQYFKDTGKYFIITLILAIITYLISEIIKVNNDILQIVIRVLLVVIVPNLLVILLFHKTNEYKYFYGLAIEQIRKEKNKWNKT